MRKRVVNCVVFVMFLVCAGSSRAVPTVLVSDGIDSEYSGAGVLDYIVAGWTTFGGTVGLIDSGFRNVLPANGFYVGLAGSSRGVGKRASLPIFLDTGDYTLSFELAGLQWNPHESGQGPPDHTAVKVIGRDLLNRSHSLWAVGSSVAFAEASVVDVAPSTLVSFEVYGIGSDNAVMCLNDLSLKFVHAPFPGALALTGVGAGVVGWLQRTKGL